MPPVRRKISDAARRQKATALFQNLVGLDLSVNSIEVIQNLSELTHLRELDLSLNHITACEGLGMCPIRRAPRPAPAHASSTMPSHRAGAV